MYEYMYEHMCKCLVTVLTSVALNRSMGCRGDPSAVGGVNVLSVHWEPSDHAQDAVLSFGAA
jgi:hypothetical protein